MFLFFVYLFLASPQVQAKSNESVCAHSRGHRESRGQCSWVQRQVKRHRFHSRFSGGPLDGSYSDRKKSLAHENLVADELKLPRFKTLEEITKAANEGLLDRIPDETVTFFVDQNVDTERHYLQVGAYLYLQHVTRDFMNDVGGTEKYPKPKVTSMVRDLDYQLHSVKSAAKCNEPETCSTHLTGATFDISFKNMSHAQYKWMYDRLLRDRDLGAINAIHEPWSGCFHIFVLPQDDASVAVPK